MMTVVSPLDIEVLANSGDMCAQFKLSSLYLRDMRHGEAFEYCKMAAEQGLADAQYSLADLYYRGTGITKSNTDAIKWYKTAYASGYPKALGGLNKVRKGLLRQKSRFSVDLLFSSFPKKDQDNELLLSDVGKFIKNNPPKHILPENPLEIH